MDLRKVKNKEIIIPKKKTKEFEIYTRYAFFNEIGEDNSKYDACEKIIEETKSLYVGIRGEVAKGGYPVCYGFSPIHFTGEEKDKYILTSWTDKDEHILHYFAFGQTEPAYLACQETTSGANFAGISFTDGLIDCAEMKNNVERNHNMGEDEVIIDVFQEYDSSIESKYQIICAVGKAQMIVRKGKMVLSINQNYDYKFYARDGSIYLAKPGEDFEKIGEDRAFVEQRIKEHKEILKKYKLENYNKSTKKFETQKEMSR